MGSSNMNKEKRNSFGLIEVLISGVLLLSVIGATVALHQRSVSTGTFSRHESIAQELAQEGVEAVRQIRDSNYLVKDNKSRELEWNCQLRYYPGVSATLPFQIGNCAAANILMTTNKGDFTAVGGAGTSTLELGNGMQMSGIFHDSQGNSVNYPSWHLSSPGVISPADSGVHTTAEKNTMAADGCPGIERVFVREGTVAGSGPIVKENRANPGDGTQADQENYLASANCQTPAPAGYIEFQRQVVVSPVDTLTGESNGNIPAAWQTQSAAAPFQAHMVRVLVRVSWFETSHLISTGGAQSVLFSTYLTDWRPQS